MVVPEGSGSPGDEGQIQRFCPPWELSFNVPLPSPLFTFLTAKVDP